MTTPENEAAPPTGTDTEASAAAEPAAQQWRVHPAKIIKGCGCASATIVLGVTVALAGGGEMSSWGSGLIGILILILVVGLSGTNGWWTKD